MTQGNPFADWILTNQVPPPDNPIPTAPEFGSTLPGDKPTPPPNLLKNPSFEGGWYHPDGRPEFQIPNEWLFAYEEGGDNPFSVWAFVPPEVRVMPADQLPPEERDLFILDGVQCVKIFKGSGAWQAGLHQTINTDHWARLTINVFADLVKAYTEDGEKIWADDPEGNNGLVRVIFDGYAGEWHSLTPGQQNRLTFDIPPFHTFGVEFICPYALANNGVFLDAWSLVAITIGEVEMEYTNLGRASTERRKGATHARLAFFRTEKIEGGLKRVWVGETDLVEIPEGVTEINAVQYIEEPEPPDPNPPIALARGAMGVDISAYQPDFWETVNVADVDFAIARCSDGLNTSATSKRHDANGVDLELWKNATALHESAKPWAIYHYLRPSTIQAQIDKVLGILAELEARGTPPRGAVFEDGTMMSAIWADIEEFALTEGEVQQFCDALNAGIYTRKSVWDSVVGDAPNWWEGRPLWVAAYGVNDGSIPNWPSGPFLPIGFDLIHIWQYTSEGQDTYGWHGDGLDVNIIGPYPPTADKPPADAIDMTQYYLPPDGRTYGDISIKSTNWGQGDVRQQLQVHDGYLFVTKGGEFERRQIVGDRIYFLLDDSPGEGRYYLVSSDTGWIPTQFGVGQTFTRQEMVTFYFKDDCNPTGESSEWTNEMLFKAFYSEWTNPHGITLANVAHLQWILNGIVEEDYYLAPGLGYAGWKNRHGRESWIKEIIPYTDQEPNKFTGACYHPPIG